MNNFRQIPGFTFIELIVVISIFSIVLLFSFPLFKDIQLFNDNEGQAGDIARLVENLKKRAIEQNADFLLHIDKISAKIWITHENMEKEAAQESKEKATQISSETQILDVQYAGQKKQNLDEYHIRFRKQGYSDFVLIHMIEDERNLTLKIEPFLPQTSILNKHINFEDCI